MTLTPMNKRLTDPMEGFLYFWCKKFNLAPLKKIRFNKSRSFIRLQDFGFNQAYNYTFYSFLKGLTLTSYQTSPN